MEVRYRGKGVVEGNDRIQIWIMRSIDQDKSNMKESTWWTNLKKLCGNSTKGKWFNEHLN